MRSLLAAWLRGSQRQSELTFQVLVKGCFFQACLVPVVCQSRWHRNQLLTSVRDWIWSELPWGTPSGTLPLSSGGFCAPAMSPPAWGKSHASIVLRVPATPLRFFLGPAPPPPPCYLPGDASLSPAPCPNERSPRRRPLPSLLFISSRVFTEAGVILFIYCLPILPRRIYGDEQGPCLICCCSHLCGKRPSWVPDGRAWKVCVTAAAKRLTSALGLCTLTN